MSDLESRVQGLGTVLNRFWGSFLDPLILKSDDCRSLSMLLMTIESYQT